MRLALNPPLMIGVRTSRLQRIPQKMTGFRLGHGTPPCVAQEGEKIGGAAVTPTFTAAQVPPHIRVMRTKPPAFRRPAELAPPAATDKVECSFKPRRPRCCRGFS